MAEPSVDEHPVRTTAGRVIALLDAATEQGWITTRTAKVIKTSGVPVLALAALVWAAFALLRPDAVAQPRLYAEFVDESGSSYLDVQLDRSASSYGAFSAFLPGVGRVWPTARVEATPVSTRVIKLHYEGVGHQDSMVLPENSSAPTRAPRGGSPLRVVPLRLVGQVDPVHHAASVDVWVNGNHHHIGSSGQVVGADAVASDFLAALRTGDWNKLYSLEDRYMRNGAKRDDFVTALAGISAATRIRSAEAIGPADYSTTESGVSYARIPIRLTYAAGTGTTPLPATLDLVVNEGAWKVLSLR